MIFLLFRIMNMKAAQKQLTRETGKCVPYRSQYISDSSMGTGTQYRETFIADQRHRQFILKSIGNLIAVILLNKEPFKMSGLPYLRFLSRETRQLPEAIPSVGQ